MASELEVGKVKIAATDGSGGLVHENASGIQVGTDSNTTIGFIGTLSNHPLKLLANNDGKVTIATNGLATFSGGIAFSQTNASGTGITSDASTLSHYEVGRWTPKYEAATGNDFNAITYGFQDGHYVRVGNVCTLTAHMRTTNVDQTGMTTSANLLVGGLPFPAATVTGTNYGFGVLSIGTSYAGNTPTTIKLSEGASAARLQYGNSNSDTQVGNMTVGSSNANFIAFQFTYQV